MIPFMVSLLWLLLDLPLDFFDLSHHRIHDCVILGLPPSGELVPKIVGLLQVAIVHLILCQCLR